MTSATDIILDRQHTTLKLCIDELHRVLDDDDNWRALAALDSVGEAAGGIMGQGWLARREELVAALGQNPVYVLCAALEQALDVCPHFGEDGATAVAAPMEVEMIVPAGADQLEQTGYLAPAENVELNEDLAIAKTQGGDEHQEQVEQAERPTQPVERSRPTENAAPVAMGEIRRESIAARIATLELPPFDSKLSDYSANTLEITASLAPRAEAAEIFQSPSDVVADAAKRILATISTPVRAEAPDDENAREGGGVTGAAEASNPSVLELESDAINVDPPDEVDDQPSANLASDKVVSDGAPSDAVQKRQTDVTQIYQGIFDYDDHTLIDQRGFQEDDAELEAEVSIVTKTDAPQPPNEQTASEPAEGAAIDDETLERRLQRLDQQSESLLQRPEPPPAPSNAESDDEARANQWLEMIRARRAAMARGARLQMRPELPPERVAEPTEDLVPAPTAVLEPEEAEISIIETKPSRPVAIRPINLSAVGLADDEPGDGFEAEVKIVQRKAQRPISPSASPQLRSQNEARAKAEPRRPIRTPHRREAHDEFEEPGGPFFGGVEEASVEIVRGDGHGPAATDLARKTPALKGPAVNRFIKALTGD